MDRGCHCLPDHAGGKPDRCSCHADRHTSHKNADSYAYLYGNAYANIHTYTDSHCNADLYAHPTHLNTPSDAHTNADQNKGSYRYTYLNEHACPYFCGAFARSTSASLKRVPHATA